MERPQEKLKEISFKVGNLEFDPKSSMSLKIHHFEDGKEIQNRVRTMCDDFNHDDHLFLQFCFTIRDTEDLFSLGEFSGQIKALIQLLKTSIEEENFIHFSDVTFNQEKDFTITVVLDAAVFADIFAENFDLAKETGINHINIDFLSSDRLPDENDEELISLRSIRDDLLNGLPLSDFGEEMFQFRVEAKGQAKKKDFDQLLEGFHLPSELEMIIKMLMLAEIEMGFSSLEEAKENGFPIPFSGFKSLRPFLAYFAVHFLEDVNFLQDAGPFVVLEDLYENLQQHLTGFSKMEVVYNHYQVKLTSDGLNIFNGYLPTMEELRDITNFPDITNLNHSNMIMLEKRVLMVGLDASGKTTFLYKRKLDEIVTTIPTIGFNVETVSESCFNLTIWDVGGQHKIRPLWKHYFSGTHALIYFIDSTDRSVMDTVRDELTKLTQEIELAGVPFLLLANKSDIAARQSLEEITSSLNLVNLLSDRKWNIISTSAITGAGMDESFKWLEQAFSQ